MPQFSAKIHKYSSKGEKTSWTFVDMPIDVLSKLKLKNRREFRIKGSIDDVKIQRLACYPIKNGTYIIALNAELRKKLQKKDGDTVSIKFTIDTSGALKSKELLVCLKEESEAQKQFDSLSIANQNYFHHYINSAKTSATKTKRIVEVIDAMYKKLNYGEMIRGLKDK
jgi:hypothetical protein